MKISYSLLFLSLALFSVGCTTSSPSLSKQESGRFLVSVKVEPPSVDNSFFTGAAQTLTKQVVENTLASEVDVFIVSVGSSDITPYTLVAHIDFLQFDSRSGSINVTTANPNEMSFLGSISLKDLKARITLRLIENTENFQRIVASATSQGEASIELNVSANLLKEWLLNGIDERAINEIRLDEAIREASRDASRQIARTLR